MLHDIGGIVMNCVYLCLDCTLNWILKTNTNKSQSLKFLIKKTISSRSTVLQYYRLVYKV